MKKPTRIDPFKCQKLSASLRYYYYETLHISLSETRLTQLRNRISDVLYILKVIHANISVTFGASAIGGKAYIALDEFV